MHYWIYLGDNWLTVHEEDCYYTGGRAVRRLWIGPFLDWNDVVDAARAEQNLIGFLSPLFEPSYVNLNLRLNRRISTASRSSPARRI